MRTIRMQNLRIIVLQCYLGTEQKQVELVNYKSLSICPASFLEKTWSLPGLPESQTSRLEQKMIGTIEPHTLCPVHFSELF